MYIVDRGDADRRPEARMAEHPGGYAKGVPPHGTGGSRGKFLSQTFHIFTFHYHKTTKLRKNW